ncbi:MAG TPA: membrane or secreted protein [Chitinophagaceae bacterium]
MKPNIYIRIGFLFLVLLCNRLHAQKRSNDKNLVYVDRQGVLRWTKDKTEASFFGVNYTTPFAHAYRAHKALNVDMEKAIQQDVYHMSRLGFDAFRVHVWDTEISDTAGNLLENDHLRLFDFLLAELKRRNIKTIITPIAFWGNGYPERDEPTPGFARKYGKGRSTTNDTAIVAQENYMVQFFKHVNPYTKLTYGNDPDVIAVEINNEPSHSGPKPGVTSYINRLTAAVKSTGWTKPVYYNIAQSPFYSDAVAKANIDGVAFQWYPTGLVANQEVKGNFLPHVDHYTIPFDSVPEYRNKSRMVYEFDAADVLQSYMYPTAAKSFKEAGFQWVTQFAYDPLAIAHVNTEYQTHYLNLAYTPSKAISMLIASKVFHKLPRLKNYGSYPADSVFDVFRVSYKNSLSEMNSDEEFYYSNTTGTKPKNIPKLKHIAGVGSSPVVQYEGSGAYFIDKIQDGVWRLEVMPDAIYIRDPFERASPKKEVTRVEWKKNKMQVLLDELGNDFLVKALNEGNNYSTENGKDGFYISPGLYLIQNPENSFNYAGSRNFFAPQPFSKEPFVAHTPLKEVSSGRSFLISAKIVGLDTSDKVTVQVNRLGGGFGQSRTITLLRKESNNYTTEVPAELATPGVTSYRIIIQKADEYYVFPGNHKGNPFAWDNYINETWETFVAAPTSKLEIFNPTTDRNARIYPSFRRGFQTSYITGAEPGRLILRLATNELAGDHTIGFQYFFADKTKGRTTETFDKLIIRARTAETNPVKAKITLTNTDAFSFSTYVTLNNTFSDIEVPLNEMVPDSMLLLPRPYPGFLPLWFKASGTSSFKLSEIERIQVTIGTDVTESEFKKPYSLEVESIRLEKKK